MPNRSFPARDRHALARIHHRVQPLTYGASGLLLVLAVLSPDFRDAAVHVCQTLIAIILN